MVGWSGLYTWKRNVADTGDCAEKLMMKKIEDMK